VLAGLAAAAAATTTADERVVGVLTELTLADGVLLWSAGRSGFVRGGGDACVFRVGVTCVSAAAATAVGEVVCAPGLFTPEGAS
jgi:hypothetical protein